MILLYPCQSALVTYLLKDSIKLYTGALLHAYTIWIDSLQGFLSNLGLLMEGVDDLHISFELQLLLQVTAFS